jgi:hypothetical protein
VWADIPRANAYIIAIATALSHTMLDESIEPTIVKDMHIPVYGRNNNPMKTRNLGGPNFGTNHSFKRVSSFMVSLQK